MNREFAQGGGKPQENPATTRNKPSMSVAPDKRLTGLPLMQEIKMSIEEPKGE